MKLAQRWFNQRSVQDTRTNVAQLPVLAVLGPNIQSASDKNQKQKLNNEVYFQVGVTPVGSEAVIG